MPPGRFIPKAHTQAASHQTSHKQHGDTRLATVPDRPTRRVLPSPERPAGGAKGAPPAQSGRRASASASSSASARPSAYAAAYASSPSLARSSASVSSRTRPSNCVEVRRRFLAQQVRAAEQARGACRILACVRRPETDEPVDESLHVPDLTRRNRDRRAVASEPARCRRASTS